MAVPDISTINAVRGQALDIEITVPAELDLTSATVEFGIARSPTLAYEKTLNISKSGSIITAALESSDGADLPNSRYYWSCWATIASDSTPVARGYIFLTNDSRNR